MLRATTDDDSATTTCADDSRQNVLANAPGKRVSVVFDDAIRLLWPWTNSTQGGAPRYPGRWALMLATFGHRAGRSAIKNWRHGYRPPPQWACELLASLMRQRATELLSAAEALEKKKGAD